MDTKSKSTNLARALLSWLCFLLVVFALIFSAVYSFFIFDRYGSDIFNTAQRAVEISGHVVSGELRELNVYKESASSFFERLYYNAQSPDAAFTARDADGSVHHGTQYLENISKDNLYAVTDYSEDPNGITVTNDANWDGAALPPGFNYLFVCRNGIVEIFYGGEDGSMELVFSSETPGAFYTNTLTYTLDALKADPVKPDIAFAVRSEPTSYYASAEIVSSARSYANQLLFQFSLLSAAALLFLLVLILSIVFRKDRLLLTQRIAGVLKHIWIEIKVLVTVGWLIACAALITSDYRLAVTAGFCAAFFLLYLLCVDLSHNRYIWRHNILHSILNAVAGPRHGKRFEQIEYRKYMAVVAVLSGLGVLTLIVSLFCRNRSPFSDLLPIFYLAVGLAVVATLFWYAAALRDDLREYSILLDQIERMYNGDLTAVNYLPSTSPLYNSAMQLNMIGDGIKIAVEEGIKSEKTKVELVTNVSHDIKTPLTSIISYVELLKAEKDLPPHVRDYIDIISQKSDRLRHMIQDIFDVSKAATGNISLEPEYMNLKMLLQQTLADMEGLIESSALQWRIQIPEDCYPVYVDGQRMYRVFQNLIKNAAQYALDGSRVYITLIRQDGLAVFSMQNISKYELRTDGEALTGRFVRGDDSRSSSGSGLGLSIAKSFTEACGGSFRVQVNGDLFSVEITLPLREPPAAAPEAPPADTAASEDGKPFEAPDKE